MVLVVFVGVVVRRGVRVLDCGYGCCGSDGELCDVV